MTGHHRPARPHDPDELQHLVREHYARVVAFCARRVGADAAEDVAQETFVTVTKNYHRFEGRSSFSTWLLGIADNHCKAMARKLKREYAGLDDWTATTPGHEEHVVDTQLLRTALATLTPDHREAVLMHEVEGMTYAEMAEILGIPVGTVKSRLHHAFANLRSTVFEGAQ